MTALEISLQAALCSTLPPPARHLSIKSFRADPKFGRKTDPFTFRRHSAAPVDPCIETRRYHLHREDFGVKSGILQFVSEPPNQGHPQLRILSKAIEQFLF